MQNSVLVEAQVGIKSARRNINNLSYTLWNHTNDTILMAESKVELMSLLMKVRVKS